MRFSGILDDPQIVTRRDDGLFPKPEEISMQCSCPDWAGMCKHLAATLYGVGARLDHQPELAGLICESFAFQIPAPDFAVAVLKGISHLAPHAHVVKLRNEDFSRDPEVVRSMNTDPLIAHEVQPTRTAAEMARADDRLKREFPLITLPVLILHGTLDKVTRPSGSQLFYDTAGSADKTLKLYEGYYHDLLHDIGKEKVMADITGWIDARVSIV